MKSTTVHLRPPPNDTPTDVPGDLLIYSGESDRMRTSALNPNETYTDVETGRRASLDSRSTRRRERRERLSRSITPRTQPNRSMAAARPVNTSDIDRIVNERVEQILSQERERAAVAQIAENTVEPPPASTQAETEPNEASTQTETKPNDAVAGKKGMFDPDGRLILFCTTVFGPRGRLLALISFIFGTASIIAAIIHLATR